MMSIQHLVQAAHVSHPTKPSHASGPYPSPEPIVSGPRMRSMSTQSNLSNCSDPDLLNAWNTDKENQSFTYTSISIEPSLPSIMSQCSTSPTTLPTPRTFRNPLKLQIKTANIKHHAYIRPTGIETPISSSPLASPHPYPSCRESLSAPPTLKAHPVFSISALIPTIDSPIHDTLSPTPSDMSEEEYEEDATSGPTVSDDDDDNYSESSPLHTTRAVPPKKRFAMAQQQSKTPVSPIQHPQTILFQAIERIQECPFACPECSKRFKKAVHLKSHLRIHTRQKPFSCQTCNQDFLRKHDLRRHERIHAGVKPHVCQRCGKAFARKDGLRRHVNMEPHVRKFRCPERTILPTPTTSALSSPIHHSC